MRNLNESTSATAILHAGGARMTASESSQGRFLRNPEGEHDGGGAGAGAGGNNGGESQGGTGTGESGGDNGGQQFDPTSFWAQPSPPAPTPAPSGGSAGNDSGGGGQHQQQPQDLNAIITSQLESFTPPAVFTREAMEAMGGENGTYDEINKNVATAVKAGTQQAIEMNVKMLTAAVDGIFKRVEQMIDGSHTRKDQYTALETAIPSAKNPGVGPIVKSIYDRALTLNNGDSTKAVEMTKNMLAAMSTNTAGDVNLQVAPLGADSEGPGGGLPKQPVNWIEQLMQAQ